MTMAEELQQFVSRKIISLISKQVSGRCVNVCVCVSVSIFLGRENFVEFSRPSLATAASSTP